MAFTLGTRRGIYIDISEKLGAKPAPLSQEETARFEEFDLIYRSLCAVLYNYVPTSGHPGGSVSSGRIVASLLFDSMDYDFSFPARPDADIISYAAGHKALGIYAMWALRNEIARVGAPELLPKDVRHQMRLEDTLGFRRNPTAKTPLFLRFHAKSLDGHPTPGTPFIRLATGASGVGVASSIGLALGATDYYGAKGPRVHIIEGEGGLTPGRVAESLAMAGTASLGNAIMHVDWNQASIDSNRVCREGDKPGDYVQWDPLELCYLHDWNVIRVTNGHDFRPVIAAQREALAIDNGQPTAVVYRTTKGWQYGIEGKASHGAGHKLCSEGFHQAVAPLVERTGGKLPTCDPSQQQCQAGKDERMVEECFWEALSIVRKAVEANRPMVEYFAGRLRDSRKRLDAQARTARAGAPRIEAVYETAASATDVRPADLPLKPGTSTTLREELGRVLGYYNRASGGALLAAAADLLGSTSTTAAAKGFPEGFYNARSNPDARLVSCGGICEDAMSGILSGLSSFGFHTGAGSSYGAFIAPLGHIASRLHAIGNQARQSVDSLPYRTFVLICAHAGLKTGEDGPTHADPQPLQVMQENFPRGTVITLTPWEPQEIWTLVAEAFKRRPAVLVPFVTRPSENVLDRPQKGLAAPSAAATGMYLLRKARGKGDGTIVLQESGVTYAFVETALPRLEKEGVDLDVYYVASAELFDLLPKEEQDRIYPEDKAREAMGITGFTLPTMSRWIMSNHGRSMTLHPFMKGHFLGSGQAHAVLAEAGLDGESQFKAVMRYVEAREKVRS